MNKSWGSKAWKKNWNEYSNVLKVQDLLTLSTGRPDSRLEAQNATLPRRLQQFLLFLIQKDRLSRSVRGRLSRVAFKGPLRGNPTIVSDRLHRGGLDVRPEEAIYIQLSHCSWPFVSPYVTLLLMRRKSISSHSRSFVFWIGELGILSRKLETKHRQESPSAKTRDQCYVVTVLCYGLGTKTTLLGLEKIRYWLIESCLYESAWKLSWCLVVSGFVTEMAANGLGVSSKMSVFCYH